MPVSRRALTIAELAAIIGVTPSAIRQVVRRHGIKPVGKVGRANLYRPADVLGITGKRDRRVPT